MKAGNLVGIGNHNQRKTENHSNKEIDVSRSHLNYDFCNLVENNGYILFKCVEEGVWKMLKCKSNYLNSS